MRKGLNRWTIGDYVIALILILFGLSIILPVWHVFVVAFVPQHVFFETRLLMWPRGLTFLNFEHVFQANLIRTGAVTTIFITIVGTAYALFLNITLAYALLKPIPGRTYIWIFLLITMFFGGGLVPSFLLMVNLGLMNNRLAMVLPFGVVIVWVFLLQAYMRTLSTEYEESARLDGAGEITILARIILPLCKPIIATVALFAAVARWNEWFNGIMFMQRPNLWPLQLVLREVLTDPNRFVMNMPQEARLQSFTIGVQMATVIVTMLPIVCVYPFLQRHFVKGIQLGGDKG